jgi:hypothetical protein
MILILLLAIVVAAVLWLHLRWRFEPLRKLLPGPPLPSPLWASLFLGNMVEVLRDPPAMPQLRWLKQYGRMVVTAGPFMSPRVVIADPEALKDVLVRQSDVLTKPYFGASSCVVLVLPALSCGACVCARVATQRTHPHA